MTASHDLLPQLLELENAEFRSIKSSLAAHGINARGWRLYADYGDAICRRFEAGAPDYHRSRGASFRLQVLLQLFKLLAGCEMDVPPPAPLLASLLHWQLPAAIWR